MIQRPNAWHGQIRKLVDHPVKAHTLESPTIKHHRFTKARGEKFLFCPHIPRPKGVLFVRSEEWSTQMRCTSCGSASVKKSFAVFEQGQSHTTRRSRGVWVSSRGRTGLWSSRGSGARISNVAQRNGPPVGSLSIVVLSAMATIIVSSLLFLFIGAGFFLTLFLVFVSTLIVTFEAWKRTSQLRAAEDDAYSRQWYCSRCGTIFRDSSPTSLAGEPQAVAMGKASDAEKQNQQQPATLYQQNHHVVSRDHYAERITNPIQRAKVETDRDSRGLLEISRRADSRGTFHPEHPYPLDLGLVSRLASLNYLYWEPNQNKFGITNSGSMRIAQLSGI